MTPETFSRRQLLQRGAMAAAILAVSPDALLAADALEENLLATLKPGHPRLIAEATSWTKVQARRVGDPLLDAFLKRGEREARALLDMPPVVYKKDGKRLLRVSRTALRRVLLLALHFHLTNDNTLAQRAREEMKAVAAFADWNPSHFLDVGEMTAALAFGYDWLYDQLDAETRQTIVASIAEKGLRPGLKNNGWERTENNWNSVCLGGLTLGALAIADEEPQLAAQMLAKTKEFNVHGLKPYAPAGVYPEGPMYWGYGTTYQVVLLAALRSALGTDWDLSKSPGFMESAPALLQLLAPSGTFFNYSDGIERPSLEGATWWFARTLNRPELLRYDIARLSEYAASTQPPQSLTDNERLLPLAALWWPDASLADAVQKTSLPLNWLGRGPNTLAIFRSAWNDSKAMYLALKGGSASLSHGHMDAGSFIFEANGVRWGRDLGMQDYLSLESKGIDLWNGKQDGGRWSVFRLNNLSHSTLTINNQLHRVNGHAKITHVSAEGTPGAIVDLSPVFQGQATKVIRGFAFRAGSHVLIRDEIEGLKEGDIVRWAMLTKAEITPAADATQAMLKENKQTLHAKLLSPVAAKFESVAADPPPQDFDAPNPGARLLVANFAAPASGRLEITVILQPVVRTDAAPVADKLAQTALAEWPLATVSA